MRRVRRLAVGFAVAAGLLVSACAKNETDSEEVRDYLEDTVRLPHRFVYTERTPTGTVTVVQGLVEDDFRYKARVTIDGQAVLEQVVSDDTAAVRFLAPDFLTKFVDKEVAGKVDRTTDLEGIDVFEALQGQRWVVDEGGAPPQIASVDDLVDAGVDPVFDAKRLLAGVHDLTLLNVTGFQRYSEDNISPTYRSDEDPFPKPEDGSGIQRFDLAQPAFPAGADSRNVVLPGEAQFRKVAVYVKDGLVVRVAVDIGVAPTLLDDFEDFMVRLVASTAPDDVAESFRATVDSLEGTEKADFLLEGLNTLRELSGDPKVRFRSATYELQDLGADDITVALPAENVIAGDLAVLVNLGDKPPVETDESTTTTTPAGPADETTGTE